MALFAVRYQVIRNNGTLKETESITIPYNARNHMLISEIMDLLHDFHLASNPPSKEGIAETQNSGDEGTNSFESVDIKGLQAKLDQIRKACEPFIAFYNTYDGVAFPDRTGVVSYSENGNVTKITLGDLRRIAEAIKEK